MVCVARQKCGMRELLNRASDQFGYGEFINRRSASIARGVMRELLKPSL
jgi:hypothetical protein